MKVQVGGRYLTRGGDQVVCTRIMLHSVARKCPYHIRVGDVTYNVSEDGFYLTSKQPHHYDLVTDLAEAGMTCDDEGCPHFGKPHSHPAPAVEAPIPLLLHCPECGNRHIDEGEFATKPHHTHACQHCGHVWRPALVPTVGVQFLPGFFNGPVYTGRDLAKLEPVEVLEFLSELNMPEFDQSGGQLYFVPYRIIRKAMEWLKRQNT